MAQSDSIDLYSSKAWGGRIDWATEQVDIASCQTQIRIKVWTWKEDGRVTSGTAPFTGELKVDGATVADISYDQQEIEDQLVAETTVWVQHNTGTGIGSCSISVEITGPQYGMSTSLNNVTLSGSGTATPDVIARTSSFGATDAAIGSVSSITIYPETSGLSHRIKVQFGSLTGYVTYTGGFSTSAATIPSGYTSIGFTIPYDFYYQIPDGTEGDCTLTLYTLSGDTVVGDAVPTKIHITTIASRCNPTLTLSVSHDNSDTAGLTGSNTAFIRGYSDANCNVSATARYGASITRIWTTDAYTDNGNGSYTIAPVNSETITFYAQDSRGYTGSVSVNVTLVPYIVLTNNAVGGRPKPTDGSAFIQFKGDYFAGSFGAVSNTLSVQYYIEYPDGSISSVCTIASTISNNTYSAYIELSGFDYTKVYGVHVTVRDKLREVYKYAVIKQGIPVFDWGRNDFQFNVPVYMGSNHIHDLPTPEADDEPATMGYVKKLLGIDSGDGSDASSSSLFTESSSYPGCFYRTASDGSTEWLNPPMADGVVYRTMDRYRGKVVYAVSLVLSMPSPSYYNGGYYYEVPFSVSGFNSSKLVDAVIKLGSTPLPIMMTGGMYVGVEMIGSNSIYINCSGINYSATYCYAVLRFTQD